MDNIPSGLILIPSGIILDAEMPPLREVEGGTVRVGKTRISLDLIVEEYENGMTPEDIVRAYDTLDVADVYGAIAYYLRHKSEVSAYIKRGREIAEALRAEIESRFPPISREELLARRAVRETASAEVGK